MENLSPPPKKMENPTTQPINADVINLLKNKGKKEELPAISQAKQKVSELIKSKNIDPKSIIQIGSMAFQAINDKALYPIVVQNAIKNKIIEPSEATKGVDYKLLGGLITAGKLAEQISKGGA